MSQCLLAVHSGKSRFCIRQRLANETHVRNAAQHLRRLPISVTSLPDHADLAELEAEVLRLRDHRLLVIEGLSHLETQHRLSPALMLGRLRRLAASLGQSVICPVSRSQLEAGDAEIAFQIEEIREDDLCAAQVQIVKNRHGGNGSVNLAWDGLRGVIHGSYVRQRIATYLVMCSSAMFTLFFSSN